MDISEVKERRLSDLLEGETGVIVKVLGHGAFRKRITEMGFIKGKQVKVIKNAPLQDPVEFEVMGYKVTLRRSEAYLVQTIAFDKSLPPGQNHFAGVISLDQLKEKADKEGHNINVALVGNPNCGKTTLYNFASGSHEKVGNYGGVTVEAREATFELDGYTFNVVDLPGTYSITEYTPEELYVRKHILDNTPDVVINVVDASNLERNLYLTTQLIDMNIKVVIALNMFDELERSHAHLNYEYLGKMIGIPIVPTVGSKGIGIEELFQRVIEVYEDRDPSVRHIHINYGKEIESAIESLQTLLKENEQLSVNFSTRYLSIKLLEADKTTLREVGKLPNAESICRVLDKEVAHLEKEYGEKSETIITDAKYGFITGALGETYSPAPPGRRDTSASIDYFLTHKILGFPIFFIFMWLMFQSTFTLGSYPMDWIDAGVASLGNWVSSLMTDGPLKDLLVDGIIGGVGGVIIFLPNILIIFFFISFMEDTGYMARVSFIMDKLMHKIGLHGKSFIPLLMGFGCNVPAIMATRSLENRKDRILTMLITPFMSCSARLPVYVLLISAFFPNNQGLILFSIYIIGILMAILLALLMNKFFFSKKEVPFVMELPPYRLPTLRNTSIHMWHKGVQYINKMGSVILVASILIWALGYYPRNINYSKDYDAQIASVSSQDFSNPNTKDSLINTLMLQKASEHQENSYIGRLGKLIEPVIQPLGFDWKIGISIISGLAAKEIVVSTMGVIYSSNTDTDEGMAGLTMKLQEQVHQSGPLKGEKVFTPLVAFGLMLFVLIYFPCIAVIAAIRKEGSLGWALFTMFYTTGLAWLVAFATFQLGSLFI